MSKIKPKIKRALSRIGMLDFVYSLTDQYKRFIPKFRKAKIEDQDVGGEYDKIKNYHRPEKIAVNKSNPVISEIEINKNCNLDCVMCNTSLSKRPDFNMKLDLFENILIKMKKLGNRVTTLHTIGEPLMNKDLFKYFELLRKYKMKVFLSTNAIPLNEKNIRKLLDWTDVIYTLRFSIDGSTKDVYEKIRVNGDFDILIRNLETFKRINNGKIHVSMNSIVSTDTKEQLAHHLSFYSKYVPMENMILSLVNGLSPDNSYFFKHSTFKNHIVRQVPCGQFEGGINVLNDGSVTACCRDYQGDLVYGNIGTQEVSEVLEGEKLKQLIAEHNDRKIPKGSLCSTCYEVDKRIVKVFKLFQISLVAMYKDNWDIDAMQSKFNDFFTLFQNSMPPKEEFLKILKPN